MAGQASDRAPIPSATARRARATSRSSDPEFSSGGGAGTGGRAVQAAGGTARTAQLEVVGAVRLYSVVPSTVWAVK
jgi:hypothetical protein